MEKSILYITGKGVLDEEQKRALYLHVAGMDVRENYFILASDFESATFEATVNSLMIVFSQRQTFFLRDICFKKSCRKVKKPFIS